MWVESEISLLHNIYVTYLNLWIFKMFYLCIYNPDENVIFKQDVINLFINKITSGMVVVSEPLSICCYLFICICVCEQGLDIFWYFVPTCLSLCVYLFSTHQWCPILIVYFWHFIMCAYIFFTHWRSPVHDVFNIHLSTIKCYKVLFTMSFYFYLQLAV